jgi:hypothetical protein
MTTINDLIRQRAKLATAADCIAGAMRDIERFGKEGSEAAGYAACWAAVMMATGIVKTGLSAVNKQAAAGFALIDNGIAQANKWLGAAKMPTITTKSELMKGVDPNLAGAAGFLRDVQQARGYLKKAGAKPPAHLALVLDLATQMSEDTILMLQAGQLAGQVSKNTRSNLTQVAARLHSMKVKISRLDSQVQMLMAKKELMDRTA